jgi:predicted oxidoreductase (fatty acid repression mutant protein)
MCNREGCQKPVRAMGYCVSHYSKYKHDRNAALGKPRINYRAERTVVWTKDELENFWQFVKKELKIV